MSGNDLSFTSLDAAGLLDAIILVDKQILKSNRRMYNMIRSLDNKINTINADVVSLRADITELKAFANDTATPASAYQAMAFAE